MTASVVQRSIHRRLAVAASFAVLGLAIVGSAASAADGTVSISGNAFAPRTVTVEVGDTVTWTNSDARAHTATADGGTFDTGAISRNAGATVTFSNAGTFPYHCSIHPDMAGTIVVQAAGATQPPTDGTVARATDQGPSAGLAALGVVAICGAAALLLVVARRRRSA
jgi:plastocyanin